MIFNNKIKSLQDPDPPVAGLKGPEDIKTEVETAFDQV